MALPSKGPVVGETVSIAVECADCGHTRWLRPDQLRSFGVSLQTPLDHLASRLSCSSCRADGLPGKSVVLQAAFASEKVRQEAERWRDVRSRVVLAAGSRARSA